MRGSLKTEQRQQIMYVQQRKLKVWSQSDAPQKGKSITQCLQPTVKRRRKLGWDLRKTKCLPRKTQQAVDQEKQHTEPGFITDITVSTQKPTMFPQEQGWEQKCIRWPFVKRKSFLTGNNKDRKHSPILLKSKQTQTAGVTLWESSLDWTNHKSNIHTTISFWSFDRAEVGGVRKHIRTNQMFPPCNRERSHKDNPTGADAQVLRETCFHRQPQKITAQRPRLTYRLFSQ